MKLLSFDISSQNIGWAVFDYSQTNILLVDSGVIKPPKKNKGSIFFRLAETKKQIINLLNIYKPQEVAIEEIIKFIKGSSTANTIIALTQFNRMIGLACYENALLEPNLINVMTIRSQLKVNNITPSKEEIPKHIEHHLNMTFPWIYKINKRTKQSQIDPCSYDLADGIACGLAFILKQRPKPKKLKSKKSKN